jgi:hypothetical protein
MPDSYKSNANDWPPAIPPEWPSIVVRKAKIASVALDDFLRTIWNFEGNFDLDYTFISDEASEAIYGLAIEECDKDKSPSDEVVVIYLDELIKKRPEELDDEPEELDDEWTNNV